VVDPDGLDPAVDVSGGALVAVAAYVGATRLIDNVLLGPAKSDTHEGH
jgi:pantoate--beta-alanine ligase